MYVKLRAMRTYGKPLRSKYCANRYAMKLLNCHKIPDTMHLIVTQLRNVLMANDNANLFAVCLNTARHVHHRTPKLCKSFIFWMFIAFTNAYAITCDAHPLPRYDLADILL
jgi:hypothetical protein